MSSYIMKIHNNSVSASDSSLSCTFLNGDSSDLLLISKSTKTDSKCVGRGIKTEDPAVLKLTQMNDATHSRYQFTTDGVDEDRGLPMTSMKWANNGINVRDTLSDNEEEFRDRLKTAAELVLSDTYQNLQLQTQFSQSADNPIASSSAAVRCFQNDVGFVESERQLMKNIMLLSIASMLSIGSFEAIQNAESSLFLETGIGVKALSIVYLFAAISELYSQAFVTRLGPNWTIGTSFCAITIFISSHFYPRPLALIPSSIFLGLLFGPLTLSQIHFLSQLTSRVLCLTTTIRDKLEQKYHRLLHLLLSSSHVFGNLSLALIFHYSGSNSDGVYLFTRKELMAGKPSLQVHYGSEIYIDTVVQEAGLRLLPAGVHPKLCSVGLRNQCSSSWFFNWESPGYVFILGPSLSLVLIGFFVGVTLIGAVIIIGALHKFDVYIDQDPLERGLLSNSVRNVISRALRDNHLRLMLPMAFFIGIEQGFFAADFNKSYVSCALGLEAIGLVMMTHAVTHLVGSLLVHGFIQHIQRPVILIGGVVCQAGLLMILALWKPDNDDIPVFYVTAVGWGLCNAIWETLTLTNILKTFVVEEWSFAFTAFTGIQFLGLSAAFACSYYICQMIKIYAIALMLPFTVLPFACAEIKFLKEQKLNCNTTPVPL